MNEQSNGETDEPIAWFESSIRSAASALGLEVSVDPKLVTSEFRGGDRVASSKLNAIDLPQVKGGLRIGSYSVVLGVLPDSRTADAVRETVRRYRNQCVVARSFLSANEALDLHLMLIGPRGSENDTEWQALGLMVERDDRVARKLTWLRPSDIADDRSSFAGFLKRTFLARPWSSDERFSRGALDMLNAARDPNDLNVPMKTAAEWEAIALGSDENPTTLVEAIVEAWKRRSEI